jgi:DNA-binding MarR family transcriptional regulator
LRREVSAADRPPSRELSLAVAARLILDQARRRSLFIHGAIFEDPQWLVTLELFVAAEEGRDVSVTNACSASGVPSTTALRHISHLEQVGILERVSHPRDRRIRLVRLSDNAHKQVAHYLSSLEAGDRATNGVASAGRTGAA